MTEPQDAQGRVPEATPSSIRADRKLPSLRVEMEGRSWTIVDLEDGLSWNLYADDPRGRGPAHRLAHIVVSDQGYFSTDAAGVVRGPYTTLDEAAYPLALDKRVLLDDAGGRARIDAPVLLGTARPRRRLLLVVATVVATVLVTSMIAAARRDRSTER